MNETPEKPVLWYFCCNDHESRIIASEERPKMRYEGGKWTLMSGGRITSEEELRKINGIQEKPCVECGNLFATTYENKAKLIAEGVCFACNFWREYIGNKEAIRVGGEHRMDGGISNRDTQWNGFGGAWWEYQREGEKPKQTNNLWSQGTIPERFRSRLPDNATLKPIPRPGANP